jgi:IclR family KDG regulon transcriptional repressor
MNENNLVNSVLKALDVLKLVGDSDKGLRLSEIADALSMKLPATHNLTRTLLARGFLEKRNNNRLYIGSSFMEIAENQLHKGLVRSADRELQRLYDSFPGGVVVFGIAANSEIRQMMRISPDRPQVLQRLNGDAYHPYANASGLVGMAFLPDSAVLQIEGHHPFAEYGAHLWKNSKALEGFLAAARKDKLVICPFDTDRFFRAAVPILDRNSRLLGVIGMSMPAVNIHQELKNSIIDELKQAAKRLEKD